MMMQKQNLFPCLFIFFTVGFSQTLEAAYEVPPFIRVDNNGTVERLLGNDVVPPSNGVQSKDMLIDPATGVSARLFIPNSIINNNLKIPLLVYFHGGAFLAETAFSPKYHSFVSSLSVQANVVAISVNYRKAPEYPIPTAYNDCWAALKWVASHSTGAGTESWIKDYVDLEHVFLAGDSAGGNIAHNLGIRLGSEKLDGTKIRGIVLLNPYFWGKNPIGNETTDVGLRTMVNKWWVASSPSRKGLDDPLINPLVDPRFSSLGCKRVLVFVSGNDIFRYRGLYYHTALEKSSWGGVVDIVDINGEPHVFFLDTPLSEHAIALVKRLVSFIDQD